MRRSRVLLPLLALACTSSPQPEPPAPPAWEHPQPLPTDPGRVTLHRLNAIEFERTLQAVLLADLQVAHTLPPDGIAQGFDNNAEAQTMSVLQLETFETAIDAAIADAMRAPITLQTERHEPESDSWSGGGSSERCAIGTWPDWQPCVALWWNNAQAAPITVKHAGPYTVRMHVCQAYNEVDPELVFQVNNEVEARWIVSAPCDVGEVVEASVTLAEGLQDIGVAQINRDGAKMVAVDWLELEGPLDADGALPPGRARYYTCALEPDGTVDVDCARDVVHGFMDEAWRRPVLDAEVDEVMAVFDEALEGGSDVHHAVRLAFKRTLMSPWFLFRVELPADPDAADPQDLSAHELAARLSYFLWSGPPDTLLRAAADDGSLTTDGALESHVRRMLADPRADALVDGLGAQWLGLRDLANVHPDAETYPGFSEELRAAMHAEVRDLTHRALLGDASMMSLLTAQERLVQPPLDGLYGVSGHQTDRVHVPGRSGAGLLSMAGWLTATSNPTRSNPVRRGAWVVGNLMCEKPPPPPDGVETELDETGEAGTIAEQLAAHRADPACAACHDTIDPVGLALEPFDGVGAHRSAYPDGTAIDPAGELPGVGTFTDVSDLATQLAAQRRTARCMVQKSFTYALGRGTTAQDWPFIEPVEQRFVDADHRFEELAVGIVLSEPFRKHRGDLP